MEGHVLLLFLPLFVGLIIVAAVGGGLLKWLAPSLRYLQGFLISLVGYGVSVFLLLTFYVAKVVFALTPIWDLIVSLALACVAGAIITRLAKNYGVEKNGWLGVGGKVVLSIYILGVIFIVGLVAIRSFH